jgi:methylaspartate mutase epsilon subunit
LSPNESTSTVRYSVFDIHKTSIFLSVPEKPMAFDIRNERLSDEGFFKKREEVLKQWETGKQVANLNESIAAARELSQGKSYALTLAEHKAKGMNLLEPQFGQALTKYMIEGLTYVETNSDLYPHGVWTIFSDTYTRKCDFARAAAGMERSRREGMSMLNGWPIVCCGVEEAREIIKAGDRISGRLEQRQQQSDHGVRGP